MKFLLPIIPFILFLGCSQRVVETPTCLYPPQTLLHKRIKKAMGVVSNENLKTYQYEINNQPEEEDQLWNSIENDGDQSFTQVAITNIYEKNKSEREYYALEQQIDLKDTSNRKPAIEYQFVVNQDTAYIRVADRKELRYTGISTGNLYLLEGYAHTGNPEPEQYRWWSPEHGDVITWYGEGRFLVLQDPIDEKLKALVNPLKEKFQ